MNKSLTNLYQNMKETNEQSPENLDYYSDNLDNWSDTLASISEKSIQNKKPIIINLAGPSSGGKSHGLETLVSKLENKNLNVLQISTDDYYKGISQMVLEKVLPQFDNLKPEQYYQVIADTKRITKESSFDEKFKNENLDKIAKILPREIANNPGLTTKFQQAIQKEFSQLDFDTPNAIHIDTLAKDIDRITNKENFEKKIYSMSESEPQTPEETSTEDIDVLIVEGIFALNKEIIKNSDLLSFIEAPNKAHLILRRFYRDVLGPNPRTTQSPEISLMIQLKHVFPGALETIFPDKKRILQNKELKNKFYHCNNPYTPKEEFKLCKYTVQDKIKISPQEQAFILKKLIENNYQIIDTKSQKDYYLVDQNIIAQDPEGFPKHILRIREFEDGKFELTYKGKRWRDKAGKMIRSDKTIVKKDEFGTIYNNPEELLKDFEKSGFTHLTTIEKERITTVKDNIKLMIDQIPSLGNFIEFSATNKKDIPEIEEIKKELSLSEHKSYGPYFDQVISQK